MSEDTSTPAEFVWPEGTIKGSERFFDLLKNESERLTNKIRVSEDRARGNSTAAVAAVGLVTLLRAAGAELPFWILLLFVLLVLVILGLSLAILFNRSTTGIKPAWMWEERTRLWKEDRSYLAIMQSYQKGWIDNIEELHKLQRGKYLLLDVQNIALLLLLLVLLGQVGFSLK